MRDFLRRLGRFIHNLFHEDFYELAADANAWSRETFGWGRGPLGSISHLKEEVDEVEQTPYDAEEYADCLLLVLDAAARANIDAPSLIAEARRKLIKNKTRTWAKAANGHCKHVG